MKIVGSTLFMLLIFIIKNSTDSIYLCDTPFSVMCTSEGGELPTLILKDLSFRTSFIYILVVCREC